MNLIVNLSETVIMNVSVRISLNESSNMINEVLIRISLCEISLLMSSSGNMNMGVRVLM